MKPGTHLHFVTCTLPRCRCSLLSLVLPPFAPALVVGHSFPARIAATAICGQTGRPSSLNLNRSTAKSASNRCMYMEGMTGESRCTAALASPPTSRSKMTENGSKFLAPNRRASGTSYRLRVEVFSCASFLGLHGTRSSPGRVTGN